MFALTAKYFLQVRDSLAQTLNTEIMDTIQKLDKIGRSNGGPGQGSSSAISDTIFQKIGHVAHVHVTSGGSGHVGQDEQYSSSTSGIYSSVEGSEPSEGSNSPEYNSWRSRVQPPGVNSAGGQRWSIQGKDNIHCQVVISVTLA